MPKLSAGLLLFRQHNGVEVMLLHPGGPFWAKKDAGAWSLPKGEYQSHEVAEHAARREFKEETGHPAPDGEALPLGEAQYGNKRVIAWAIEADFDATKIVSNTVTMEWPPKSGKTMEFPECDRAEWCSLAAATQKLVPGQRPFVERLAEHLGIQIEQQDTSDQLSLL